MNIYKELSKFNHIKYHDEPHKYFIGEQDLISGTAFIGLFKEKFDSPKMAEKTAKKKGIPVEEVLAEWDFKGDFSRTKGTLLHNFAENYWMNKVFPVDLKSYDDKFGETLMTERYSECQRMFLEFYNDSSKSLCPIAMELVVGDKELGIGGMVDGLFWNQKMGELQIWDYKTNKEIATYSKYRKKMLAPINFLQECEMTTYSIQLNLYKYIIQKNTNLKIGKCYLVHIHEEQDKYNVIECLEYQDIVELLIKHYKQKTKWKTH
jgi:ATP-dependent exoDNAse (exonuclease V) beta subunit